MAAAAAFWDVVTSALHHGNVPLLKEAERASGIDLRRLRGFNGGDLLQIAVVGSCMTGRLDVCRYLVEEKGFDVNSTSVEGETPIFVATNTDWLVNGRRAAGVVPVLTYFLSRGVDPAAADAKGCTPLHNAAEHGHSEAVELLLSRGIPVDPLKPSRDAAAPGCSKGQCPGSQGLARPWC